MDVSLSKQRVEEGDWGTGSERLPKNQVYPPAFTTVAQVKQPPTSASSLSGASLEKCVRSKECMK